ncbi:MAG: hypothetical protein WC881_06760 [Elusimicrobiota bacterium]
MKMHLFEFNSVNKKLKCLCGWERTLKTTDIRVAYEKFKKHCSDHNCPAAH